MVAILLKKKPREHGHLQKMPAPNRKYGYLITLESHLVIL